jgi:hypothetical protein
MNHAVDEHQWLTAPGTDLDNDPRRHSPARRRVEAAVARLQQAIEAEAREAEEARAAQRRRASAQADDIVATAERNARVREAMRDRYVSVDRKWLAALMETACDALAAEKHAALERREQHRANCIADQIDRLAAGYERALARGDL